MARRTVDEDLGEDYRARREAQQERRAARLPGRTDEILALRLSGFRVVALTAYQFRVDDRIDLFPIHQKWHDIRTNTRGRYITPRAIVDRRLRGTAATLAAAHRLPAGTSTTVCAGTRATLRAKGTP